MKPAHYVIRIFGGVRATARAIGRTPGTVSKWRQPKNNRGTGGYIPNPAQQLILAAARRLGLDITPQDLLVGRKVPRGKRKTA